MPTISERIKEALAYNDMKQADLIKKTGINKSALSSYLSGKYDPKQNNIYLMAKALNVNEAWLMGKDVPMERIEYNSVPTPSVPKLCQEEQQLLDRYNMLDQEDQKQVIDFIDYKLSNEKYTKQPRERKVANE